MNEEDSKKIIVNKFGGGIMISEFIDHAKKRVEEQLAGGYKPVVVVSALKGITDELILFYELLSKKVKHNQKIGVSSDRYVDNLINPFIENIRKKHIEIMKASKISNDKVDLVENEFESIFNDLKNDLMVVTRFGSMDVIQDKIISYGEKLSALFFATFLNSNGIRAKRYVAEDIPIVTNSNHLDADICFDKSKKNVIEKVDVENEIPVIPGFTGRSEDGNITTLGRGGTDTTACFIAAALRAEKVILWKDVEGVLSADPRIVSDVITVPFVSFQEAEESGKVIHDKAIQYVKMHETMAEVASILDYTKKTVVGPADSSQKGAKIIGFKKALTLMLVTDDGMSEYGFLFTITKVFKEHEINMVLIRNTRDSLHIVVENNNGNLKKAVDKLEEKGFCFKSESVNMVTLIGTLDWRMVNDFNDTLINICPDSQIGAFPYRDCVRLEAIVKTDEMEKLMRELHKVFIE